MYENAQNIIKNYVWGLHHVWIKPLNIPSIPPHTKENYARHPVELFKKFVIVNLGRRVDILPSPITTFKKRIPFLLCAIVIMFQYTLYCIIILLNTKINAITHTKETCIVSPVQFSTTWTHLKKNSHKSVWSKQPLRRHIEHDGKKTAKRESEQRSLPIEKWLAT